jgi:hypothetical protein
VPPYTEIPAQWHHGMAPAEHVRLHIVHGWGRYSAAMRPRRALCLLGVAAGLAAAGCGGSGGNGFGCQGNVCTASYSGTGSQDLSSELGPGTKIEIRDIGKGTAVVRAGGVTRALRVGRRTRMGTLRITLRKADGDSATLRVVKVR